jgi:cytochrome P450
MFDPMLLTSDPEIIKQITITKRLPKASVVYDFLKPIFGNGILLSSGELWKKQRTLINPIFTPQNVSKLIGVMESHTHDSIANWKKQGRIDLSLEMSTLTLKIISESYFIFVLTCSAFGDTTDQNETSKLWNAMVNNLANYVIISTMIPVSILNHLPFSFVKNCVHSKDKMREIIKGIINERKNKIKHGNDENEGDLLNLLMTAELDGERIPEELIIDESFTFLFAGHDVISFHD